MLAWGEVDPPVQVLSTIGLGFLLLLSGLEIDVAHLRGALLRVTAAAYVLIFAIALAVGAVLAGAGLILSPLLVAVILSATSLGIILPVLQDGRQLGSPLGRAKIPIFLVALLVARGLPAICYRLLRFSGRQVAAAGLLQATSVSLPAVAGAIGVQLGLMRPETFAALITAGLISVLAFPPVALRLARNAHEPRAADTAG